MEDLELFDRILAANNLGRSFDASRTPTHAAAVEQYLQRARDIISSAVPKFRGISRIFVGLCDHPEFNAWATRVKDDDDKYRYFIGIHAGLLSIINVVANRMLADPLSFPHIGDPKMELGDLPVFSNLVPNASECDLIAVRPLDWRRELYAVHLSQLMFDFIVAHEVTHIGHGHVAYMNAEYGLQFLGERCWMQGTPSGNLESLAMEMDADFKAAELVVSGVERFVTMRDKFDPPLAEYYSSPARAMFDAAAAISIQSRMFGDTRLTLSGMANEDHPPDSWRQMMVLTAMGNHAENIWGDEVGKSVMNSINLAITSVEEMIERLTGRPRQVEGLHDVLYGEGWDYADAVTACWNTTLRAKLANHALVEIPMSYSIERPIAPGERNRIETRQP